MFYTIVGSYYHIKKKHNNSRKSGEKKVSVDRISCKEYNDNVGKDVNYKSPKVGDRVMIIIKPYCNYECKTGIVKNVLTKHQFHTRGHKVRLETGIIGRVVKSIT